MHRASPEASLASGAFHPADWALLLSHFTDKRAEAQKASPCRERIRAPVRVPGGNGELTLDQRPLGKGLDALLARGGASSLNLPQVLGMLVLPLRTVADFQRGRGARGPF